VVQPQDATATVSQSPDPQDNDAAEVMGYPLTREELLILARHWLRQDADIDWFIFAYQCFGRSDFDAMYYARFRFNRIMELLGGAAVQNVIDQVRTETREKIGEEAWRIFNEGSVSERDRITEEIHECGDRLTAKLADVATCRAAFAFLAEHPSEVYFDSAGDLWHLSEVWERNATQSHLMLQVRTKNGGVRRARLPHPRPGGLATRLRTQVGADDAPRSSHATPAPTKFAGSGALPPPRTPPPAHRIGEHNRDGQKER
jgi:hypothetical protein